MVGEELDEQVREYIRELRKLGVIINAHVVIAVGMGLVLNKDANLLEENSGHIQALGKVSSFENGFCEEKS